MIASDTLTDFIPFISHVSTEYDTERKKKRFVAGYVRSRECAQTWVHSGKHQRVITCVRVAFRLSDGSGHQGLRSGTGLGDREREPMAAEGLRDGKGEEITAGSKDRNLNLYISVHTVYFCVCLQALCELYL